MGFCDGVKGCVGHLRQKSQHMAVDLSVKQSWSSPITLVQWKKKKKKVLLFQPPQLIARKQLCKMAPGD